MKIAPLLIYIPFFFLPYSSFSQEYGYTHYDIAEGLAGSTVYCITQDQDGFIWVGTETGVSRFDGTHFKNFTTVDGLPDIEVLQIFGDSKGRVWMAPFRKSICYYYQGRIHNQENDAVLRRIRLNGNIEGFAEDDRGNILIQERTALHLVLANGMVKEYDSIEGRPVKRCLSICRSASGHFLVEEDGRVWNFSGEGFSFFRAIAFKDSLPNYIAMSANWVVWRESPNRSAIESLTSGQISYRLFEQWHYKHITYSLPSDSLVYFNEVTGAAQFNWNSGKEVLFLPGKQVSRTFRDQDGNLWFTTLGQGLFRLNSDNFKTISLQTENQERTSVHAIAKFANYLWVGDNHNHLLKMSLPDHKIIAKTSTSAMNRVIFIDKTEENDIVIASDIGITRISSDMRGVWGGRPGVKSACRKSKTELLIASSWGAAVADIHTFRLTDTLWRERSTAIYYHDSAIFLGTMDGLYRINPDKSIVFLGKSIPFLRKRISSIAESDDHTFWVASYDDAGVIGIRNDRVVAAITKKQGLTSDICRTLLVHDHVLWIGTDKGLNRIELDKPGYPVTSYTSDDGLGSDMINTLYADDSIIYVGTTNGLTYFKATAAKIIEECRLHLLSVTNAGVNRVEDTCGLLLPYNKSDIRMDFAAVSYRSSGNITYQYRLLGLDSGWKETNATYLEYLSLPSGKYQFELRAVNKFGISSKLLSFNFTVATPFWRTIWFYAIILLVFLSLVWLAVSLRIKAIQRRQEEKEQLQRRMTELEHKALQSQMNPHFIFNCLNSIQQYIFAQDIFAANKYITGFAKLIRATLNNSTRTFIPLSEEADYLTSYLSLEKLRFKDKMDYFIDVDPGIDRDGVLIPPMLIQPYVENSMRHGLRHKTEGKGYIRIQLMQMDSQLVVIVEDNGIGRERAAQYKTGEHIEYQSKGMTLTAERIRMMNAGNEERITVEVIDLKDAQDRAAGTRVTISFPLFHTILKKKIYDSNCIGRR